jgi:hypothetical protein
MSETVVIYITCDNESDAEWLRDRAVPAVENAVDESAVEGRLDGNVEVSWTIESNPDE